MSETGRPTKGMRIRGIRLFGCSFGFEPEADVQKRVEAFPEKERELELKVNVNVVDQAIQASEVSLGLIVEVKGVVRDVVVWTIGVAYQGVFTVDADCEITPQQAVSVHGPAQIYAFAREFVSDISRRADFNMRVYLPPWNFTGSDGPFGTQVVPGDKA